MNDAIDQVSQARQWALFYRDCGYQPLPSKADRKQPALSTFAEYFEIPLPATMFTNWHAPNIQLVTGQPWRLCVIDCDGARAHDIWQSLCADHAHQAHTWTVRTGRGGWHYYYTLPPDLDNCRSRRIWGLWDPYLGPRHQGGWSSNNEIRLLGDRSLVVAPPSVHVETEVVYGFVEESGPTELPMPMPAPAWLLELPAQERPRTAPPPPARPPRTWTSAPTGPLPDRYAVLDAIGPNKHLVAQQYGLRLAARGPNPEGWVACHAFDREDRDPSCSIHHEYGIYYDFFSGEKLSFFDLLAALAPGMRDWRDALSQLGAVQGVHPRPRREFHQAT